MIEEPPPVVFAPSIERPSADVVERFRTPTSFIVDAMNGLYAGSVEQEADIYRVGLNTTRLLLALGDLVVGWLLARQAEVAIAKLDLGALSASDHAFYDGKVAAAGFFAATVLPRLAAEREIAETTSLDPMELAEEAF